MTLAVAWVRMALVLGGRADQARMAQAEPVYSAVERVAALGPRALHSPA